MIKVIWNLSAFIVTIAILIIVHEGAHALTARYFGVKIKKISFGFGKKIFHFLDNQGTEFIISAIPLGGYVQLYHSKKIITDQKLLQQIFINKKIWQRMLIIAAGPIANFLFAIVIYWSILMSGFTNINLDIHRMMHGYTNSVYIVQSHIKKNYSVIHNSTGNLVNSSLLSNITNNQINIEKQLFDRTKLPIKLNKNLNAIKYFDTVHNKIIFENQVNDDDNACNDCIILPLKFRIKYVITRLVNRARIIVPLLMNPYCKLQHDSSDGFPRIVPEKFSIIKVIKENLFIMSIINSILLFWGIMKFVGFFFKNLIASGLNLNFLNGPIAIALNAGNLAKRGFYDYLLFLSLMSINVGIINLIPLPVLDGGQLLFLLIEKIRGKALSENVTNIVSNISVILIFLLILRTIFNDLLFYFK